MIVWHRLYQMISGSWVHVDDFPTQEEAEAAAALLTNPTSIVVEPDSIITVSNPPATS